MSWLATLGIALLTAVIGMFVSGLVADLYCSWNHLSNHGAAFHVLGMAILGGLLSFVVGIIAARLLGPSFGKALASSTGIVLGINGLIALCCYLLADIPPTLGGEELMLEVEIQMPADHPKPQGEGQLTLASVVLKDERAWHYGELKLSDAWLEDQRWIVPAEVLVFTSRGARSISAKIGEAEVARLMVPLPAHPVEAQLQWSAWEPQSDTQPSFRFRVRRIPAPPPPPTTEEWRAQNEAKARAKFDAIPLDAPISAWMDYVEPHMSEKRRVIAMQRITSKPTFVAELSALMLTDGPYDEAARRASAAMRLISRIEKPSAEMIPGVTAAGCDIIARIRKFNASKPEQDPHYEAAADADLRFSAWMDAVRTLRAKANADFIPELREILELSRLRTDSVAMQTNVRRIASFYMHEWAGIEPLPGDPRPR
jgi:hypothetical protein